MEKNGTTQGSINFKGQVADLSGEVHLLPCAVKYNGPCSVSDYFKPKSIGLEVEGLSVKEAHFRGRKLQGATISIPDGYSGISFYNAWNFYFIFLNFCYFCDVCVSDHADLCL